MVKSIDLDLVPQLGMYTYILLNLIKDLMVVGMPADNVMSIMTTNFEKILTK
jgi:predicted amidohydrolase